MSNKMTVADLIKRLSEFPGECCVEFESPGNYSVQGRIHRWAVLGAKEANYSDDGKYVVLVAE